MTSSLIEAMRSYAKAAMSSRDNLVYRDSQQQLLTEVERLSENELLQLAHDRQRLDWLERAVKDSGGAITFRAMADEGGGRQIRCTHNGYAGERQQTLRESIDVAYGDLNRPVWDPS